MKNTVKLGEICKIVTGSTPKSNVQEFWNGNLKWLTPAELDDNSFFVYDTERKITIDGVKATGLKPFPAGTVILSSRAPIGKVAVTGCEMYCNQGFKNLICGSQIHNIYLYWFLKSKTEFLNSLGRGATFKEISKAIVENIEIPLPSYNQQESIAKQFNVIQKLIVLYMEQHALLETLVKSRFIEMFGDLNISPKYPSVDLNSVCKMITGGTPSSKHPEYYGGNIPFVSTPCLGKNYIDEKDAVYFITEEGLKNSTTHLIPAGSLMFGNRVGVGKSSINKCAMCTNQDIVSITNVDSQKFDLLFIKAVLDQFSSTYDNNKRGATIKGIPTSVVKATQIPNVSINVQHLYTNFVKQVDKSKFDGSNQEYIYLKWLKENFCRNILVK